MLVLGALAVWLLASGLRGCVPSLDNPFATETVDRSRPAVLRAVEDLERFEAAAGHFEVIVDVEKDTRLVPAVIRGERVLFVAVGDVDAGVDFSRLDDGAVTVSDDRTSVELTLPSARLFDVRVDPEASYVYDRDRGLVDRVASLFQDNPTSEQELYVLAEVKLRIAAGEDGTLLRRAETNTRRMLTGLLRALGFERIVIRFAEDED